MASLTITTGPQEAIDYINGKLDKTAGHKHDGTDENGGIINSQYIINTPSGVVTKTNIQEAINEIASFTLLGRIHTAVRQTVLQGSIDAGGTPNFLQIGTGLSVNLLASTTPIVLAFAYGFNNNYGQIDHISSIISDQAAFWSNLPTNKSFLQLYIDHNLSTGVLTGGYTERETIYGAAPSHFNTQHWYDENNTCFMKVSNGTSWSNVQRIMVGECTTDASTVTGVICYAIQGKSIIDSGSLAADQLQTLSHHIGRVPTKRDVSLVCVSADQGWAVGDEIINITNYYATTPGQRWSIGIDSKNITTIIEGDITGFNKSTKTVVTLTLNKWKFRIRCEA